MADVYPDLQRLERRLGLGPDESLATVETLEVDGEFLRGLLSIILSDFALNERLYSEENEVEAEFNWGDAKTLSDHFAMIGYFAGAAAAPRNFDATWYLSTYPEARAAVDNGTFETALDHYMTDGQRQGRSPNVSAQDMQARWRRILSRLNEDEPIKLAELRSTTRGTNA